MACAGTGAAVPVEITSAMTRVLISGGGVTGASVYHYLATLIPALSDASYTVWERGPSVGGRMGNSYLKSCHLHESANAPLCEPFCEMGAQYLTKSDKTNDFDDVYKRLLDDGVITSLEPRCVEGMKEEHYGKTHYRSTKGLSRVCNNLLSGATVFTDTYLSNLDRSTDGAQWVASKTSSTSNDTTQELFDIVVLTMPFPNVLQLTGDVSAVMEQSGLSANMRKVKYSSRYALAAYYSPTANSALERIPWSAKYIYDDDIIRYIAIESRKAFGTNVRTCPVALLAHTSVPFGIENESSDRSDIQMRILSNVERILGGMPESPIQTELLYWQTSQVSTAISGYNGAALVSAAGAGHAAPLLAVAGDSFTESNFEGCLRSAMAAAKLIARTWRQ